MFNRMKRKLSFFVALVAAWVMVANVQAAYTVKFADMPHCTWTASYNGSPFTGGDVELGKTLIVNFSANPSWRFSTNDQKNWSSSKTLNASDFVDGVYTVTQPAMYQPGFKFQTRWVGDGSAAKIVWEDQSGDFKAFRLMISEKAEAGNPAYWKNAYSTTKTEQEVSGLEAGRTYYAHLQGGTDADHMSPEVFTLQFIPRSNIAPCGYLVHMWDSYGDGWNGAEIAIQENGVTKTFTLENGKEGWAEYHSNGYPATVTWISGKYDNEISFEIFAGDGQELLYVEDASYEYKSTSGTVIKLSDGTPLQDFQLCSYPCAALVTSFDFAANSDATEYTVTWDATGADSYEVAVLQKCAPTEAEINKAAKAVTDKSYKISGKANAIQHVFVRTVCNEGKKGTWADAIICQPRVPAGTEVTLPALAKKINIPYTEKGDFIANAVGLGPDKSSWGHYTVYNFTLAEDTKLMFNATSSELEYSMNFDLYQDPGDGNPFVLKGSSTGGEWELEAGNYYLVFTIDPGDEYTLKINKAKEPKITDITSLNFFAEGDFSKAQDFDAGGNVVSANIFRYQPSEDQTVFFQMNSGNDAFYAVRCFVYREYLTSLNQISSYGNPVHTSLSLTAGETYFFVVGVDPVYGGKLTDTYQFFLGRKSDEPTQTKRINLDAHITDKITKDDVVNELGCIGKVYEFVLKEDTPIAYSIEALGESADDPNVLKGAQLAIYKGDIDGTPFASCLVTNAHFNYTTFTGDASGTHYYAVVLSKYAINVDFRLDLRAKTPADNIKGKPIEINKGYQDGLSVLHPFRNNNEGIGGYSTTNYGTVNYYTAHLEKNTSYFITAHQLRDISTDKDNISRFAITVLDPAKSGSFTDRTVIAATSLEDGYWEVIDFKPTATGDYTIVIGGVQYRSSAQDTLAYEFSVNQVYSLEDAAGDAIKVNPEDMPFKHEGSFDGNREVFPSTYYHFLDNGTSWIQKNGAYDVLSLEVKVAAGDSLYVEFGGDDDVAIYIYPNTTPIIVDDVPYAYPYEQYGLKNTTSANKTYSVLGVYKNPRVQAAPYYVRVAKSANDLVPQVATAKLNQTYVNIPSDGGIADAQAALAQLVITAYNAAGEAIGTIVNRGDLWNVNLNENKASYELNDSDLPLGYKFAKTPLFLQASLRRKDVHIEEVVISESQDGAVRKVLRNGLIMIDTPYGSFDIMGRRVR